MRSYLQSICRKYDSILPLQPAFFTFSLLHPPSIHPLLPIGLYSPLLKSKLCKDSWIPGSYTAVQLTWLFHLSHDQQLSQTQYLPCESLCIFLLQTGVSSKFSVSWETRREEKPFLSPSVLPESVYWLLLLSHFDLSRHSFHHFQDFKKMLVCSVGGPLCVDIS